MRSLASNLGLSLAVLLAWLLLGGGNQAQGSFLVRSPAEAGLESGMGAGVADSKASQDTDKQACRNALARLVGSNHLVWSALGQSGSGMAGASRVPSGSNAVPQAAAVLSPVNASPHSVARWLYLEDVQYRPPPFASRLFRPPRVV